MGKYLPYVNEKYIFPNVEKALEDGLLAYGGDLSPLCLLQAYRNGVFPWFEDRGHIFWFSPNPRCVLFLEDFRVTRSLKKRIKNYGFKVYFDRDFLSTINACATVERKDEEDTWINHNFIKNYLQLFELGYAHSVEVYDANDTLVGGLYGVSLGRMFFGESMFSKVNDGSKIAMYYLVEKLKAWNFLAVDCQVPNPHLLSIGASEISRQEFLKLVQTKAKAKLGNWGEIE